MADLPQPIPQRQYVFTPGTPAVADYVNHELNTLYTVLQGGLGNVHFADQANITGTKIAVNSIPSAQLLDEVWTNWQSNLSPTGYSVGVIYTSYYKDFGNFVGMYVLVTGTSNATTFTIQLPFAPSFSFNIGPFRSSDNSVTDFNGMISFTTASTTATVSHSAGGAGWTAGGTKMIEASFIYQKQ